MYILITTSKVPKFSKNKAFGAAMAAKERMTTKNIQKRILGVMVEMQTPEDHMSLILKPVSLHLSVQI